MNTAAFIHGVRDVRIGSFEPELSREHKTLVDVAAVGICGSDIHYYKDGGIGAATISQPFVPGHEFSAYLSTDIEPLGLKRGQLVAIDPALPCHQCEWCVKGHHNLCPSVIFQGAPPYHGALTQQIAVPLQCIVPLPHNMTPLQGAMLEPLGVCVHAIDLAKPTLFDSVAVLGCGPIGLGIIQLLSLSGCQQIIGIDPQLHRVQLASDLGATAVGQTIDSALEQTDGQGCHLVIEATNSPRGFSDAIDASRIGGRVVLVGIPDGNEYATICAADARRRGLSLKFSRRMGNVYARAVELVHSGKVDVGALVSHQCTLEDTPEAFAMQADEAVGFVKSVVYPAGQVPKG